MIPSFHLTDKRRKKSKKFSVRSVADGYYTALSYHVIHDVFVMFTLLKRKLKRFGLILRSLAKV